MRAGEPADGAAAMDAAEAASRAHHARFYDCPAAMHARIAEMYVSDPRFTETYEDIETGLAVLRPRRRRRERGAPSDHLAGGGRADHGRSSVLPIVVRAAMAAWASAARSSGKVWPITGW